MDFMLIDAANDAKDFVNKMNDNPKLKEELVNTGSIIYAYEADRAEIHKSFKAAINNYGSLVEDGMIIVGVTNPNGKYHAKADSHEQQFSNGELGNVVNYFSETTKSSLITTKSGIAEENEYFLIVPKPRSNSDDKNWDYYENRVSINEKQLNQFTEYREIKGIQPGKSYLMDLVTYIGIDNEEHEGYINLASYAPATSDDKVLFKFQDIVNKANNVITEINNTSFNANGFDYQFSHDSTTDFPESLNMGNVLLYSISNNMLDEVSCDMNNVHKILEKFLQLDHDYKEKALDMMNEAYDNGNFFKDDVSLNKVNTSGAMKVDYGIFGKKSSEGTAGRISMLDIDNILAGNTLSGYIGDGLKNEYDDAYRLQQQIDEMIYLSKDVACGKAWEAEKARLEKLSEFCSLRMEASQTLETAYIESLKLIRDYIGDDEYLDDGELDKYRQDLKTAKAVPPSIGTGAYIHLPNGMDYEIRKPNEPYYSDAQKQIPILEAKITKLEGLAAKLNDANKIICDAIDEVNSKYGNAVNNYSIVNLTVHSESANR